jgi:hypothetical protein
MIPLLKPSRAWIMKSGTRYRRCHRQQQGQQEQQGHLALLAATP